MSGQAQVQMANNMGRMTSRARSNCSRIDRLASRRRTAKANATAGIGATS
jgi:hypothetical protein